MSGWGVGRRPQHKVKLKCVTGSRNDKILGKVHIYIMCPIVAKGYTNVQAVWKPDSEAVKSITTQVKNIFIYVRGAINFRELRSSGLLRSE